MLRHILASADAAFTALNAWTDVYTDARASRERTNTANKASAESYINGGNYKAVWKPVSGVYSASGIIGWERYLPGVASGAHLVNALPYIPT